MNKRLIIIGCPDKDIPGVKLDIENLENYFRSPLGGAWRDSEMAVRETPTVAWVEGQLEIARNADYSVIVYSGHGEYDTIKRKWVATMAGDADFEIDRFKIGPEKSLIIVDCCRTLRKLLKRAMDSVALAEHVEALNPAACRAHYEQCIRDAAPGFIALYAASPGQEAADSEVFGAAYLSALLQVAENWGAQNQRLAAIQRAMLSALDAHRGAKPIAESSSGYRQTPTHECSKTAPAFPFAVVA